MGPRFVTSAGTSVDLGHELGRGGEGVVFDIPARPDTVAKLYNQRHLPDGPKQSKLRYMAETADKALLSYAAWPQDTLHKSREGPVIGFLMPKIMERFPIHMLYSPAYRRQNYADRGWDFLLWVARNTAAAFAAIHNHGHVLGDVNQGNVLFGIDSKVVLIDTDSFQINANGKIHLCKVGVAHFTPPELQKALSFDHAPRSCNHDSFGLAVLIFHLLFGGRHPYSGVPLRREVGEALEKDIQSYRYAYAPDARQRGLLPPPSSIPIALVPESTQSMFVAAFTESGTSAGRPPASRWISELDGLRSQLARCTAVRTHVYSRHSRSCPWCELEGHGVIYFLNVWAGAGPTAYSAFDLARAWSAIQSVSPPPRFEVPEVASIPITPTPPPSNFASKGIRGFLKGAILMVAVGILVTAPGWWFLVLVVGFWSWNGVESIGAKEMSAERSRRQDALAIAQKAFEIIVERARKEAFSELFDKKRQDLSRLRDEYLSLPSRENSEIAELQASAAARQKQKFLERHFIDTATIVGVGPAKKIALRSFGIETAADVNWNNVIAVWGFGPVLTRAVVEWRKSCERRFVFDPGRAVTDADRDAVRARIAARRRAIEIGLNAGATELVKLRQEMVSRAQVLRPLLQESGRNLAQAQADVRCL